MHHTNTVRRSVIAGGTRVAVSVYRSSKHREGGKQDRDDAQHEPGTLQLTAGFYVILRSELRLLKTCKFTTSLSIREQCVCTRIQGITWKTKTRTKLKGKK
jgi:hypothetical protein